MLRSRWSFVSALALAAGLAACGAPPAPAMDTAADVAAVDAVRAAWTEAYNAGNAEGVAALYTSDGVFMRNHQPVLNGQSAIRDALQAQMDAMTTSITVMTDETIVFGDDAVGRGRFTMMLTPKAEGAAPMHDEGAYMVLMQRQGDGSWKITRHIGNSTLPMPMATPAN